LSVVCIFVFIICFAVGLGPIPFILAAEAFPQEARSSAASICVFTNWLSNLGISLLFPYLSDILNDYVFLVFSVIVALVAAVLIFKVIYLLSFFLLFIKLLLNLILFE
jgi:hypothetical protein